MQGRPNEESQPPGETNSQEPAPGSSLEPTGVPPIIDSAPVSTAGQIAEPQDRISDIRPGMSTWDQAFSQLQQRVAGLIESIEHQAAPDEADIEPDPEDDHLAQAAQALSVSRDAERAELPLLIERLKSRGETPSNLSGILANLPEITAEQRQALSRVDHRLELIKVRTDATADALAGAVREVEHLRRTVDELSRQGAVQQRSQAELAANQRELASSLNLLHDLVGKATATVRSNAAWVEMLADAPDARYQTLRDQFTAANARSETKSTITLITAAIAALAAVIALVTAIAR